MVLVYLLNLDILFQAGKALLKLMSTTLQSYCILVRIVAPRFFLDDTKLENVLQEGT